MFCWDSLQINKDGLLTILSVTTDRHPERVVCPFAICRELMWNTHKQAHAGVQRLWLKVKQCEICQASKHGQPLGDSGRRRLYAGCPWQVVAAELVNLMPLTLRGISWILMLMDHFTQWADALAIPDASAPTVTQVLDQNVFCYMAFQNRYIWSKAPVSVSAHG